MDYIFKTDFLDFQSKNKNKNFQYYHWAQKKRVDKQKSEYEQFRKMWFEIDQQQQKEKVKSNVRNQKIAQKKTVALRPQQLYNKHMHWKHQIEQKLQRKREQKRQEQERETDLAMLHQSKQPKLIRQQQHKGPVKAWQERFNHYIRTRCGDDYNQNTQTFAPKIDKNSRRLTKQMLGKVQDRLIQYGEKLKEKKVEMETIYEQQLHCKRNFGNTNQSIESSQISDVYWRLYKDGERLNQKRNEKKVEYTFTPQINQYSVQIASRLTQKRTPIYQSKMKAEPQKASKKQRKSTQKGFNDFLKRNQALLTKIENNKIRQMQMIREKENKQIIECTFTPVLNPKSLRMFANNITNQTNSQIQERIQNLSKIQIEEQEIHNEQSDEKKLVTAKSDLNQFINSSSKMNHSSQKIQRMHSDGHLINTSDHLFIQQHDSVSNLNNSKTFKMNESSINKNNTTNKHRSSDSSDFLATEKITPPIENIHQQIEQDSIERQRDSDWQKQLNLMERQIQAMMQRTNL